MKIIRITFLLLLTTIAIVEADAQGYKKEKLLCYYRSFPLQPLSTEFKTYQSKINPGKIDFRTIQKKQPLAYSEVTKADGTVTSNFSSPEQCEKEYLSFPGFELTESNPDILITMDFNAIDIKRKENVVKEGRLNYEVYYTYGAVLKITDNNGTLIHEEVYHQPNEERKFFIGPDGFVKTIQEFETEKENEFTTESLEKAERLIKSKWAYTLYYTTYSIATDKSNKKLNYDDLDQAVGIMKEAFELMSTDEQKAWNEVGQDEVAVSTYCAKFDEAIAIWQKALEEADYNDKKARIHRKLAPMLMCNIATAMIFKKDWDGAMEYINLAQEHKVSEDTAQRLLNFMMSQRERYEVNGLI